MGGNQHTNPVTDQTRADIRRLHAEGCGRNEIARRLTRSPRTISVEAAAMGLTFDRTATEEATRARVADLAEKRAILADALTDDALRLSAQIWQPAVVFNFGGKDNTFEKRDVPEPPALDKKALMAAATAAAAQSLRLVPPQDDGGNEAAQSLVGQLMTGLAAVYRTQQATEQAPPADDEGDGDAP
ncbi:helix-turn-helix domain-containing protein [Streptomyces sp. PKU-MA01144]|uniref:helix-turn-helix domain-containing protein n=1 Tax=Streptomyces sp. PKU-MA01144 TaxID=2729138 RepID=UPI00147FF849|nr:helix-turn-helix domain-containing protein [Streptomyces sp. PKU-MA01144]NNJ04159.1 helix-turn-helix domain-containing protein [Streptomyces sp. PKU-MA01144]